MWKHRALTCKCIGKGAILGAMLSLGLVDVPAYERLAYVRGIRAVCALSPPTSACEGRSHHGASSLRRWRGEQKEYETVVAPGTFDIGYTNPPFFFFFLTYLLGSQS